MSESYCCPSCIAAEIEETDTRNTMPLYIKYFHKGKKGEQYNLVIVQNPGGSYHILSYRTMQIEGEITYDSSWYITNISDYTLARQMANLIVSKLHK